MAWQGSIRSDRNTLYNFCKVSGRDFGTLGGGEKGWLCCPKVGKYMSSGWVHNKRRQDIQDGPVMNESWIAGDYAPNFMESQRDCKLVYLFLPWCWWHWYYLRSPNSLAWSSRVWGAWRRTFWKRKLIRLGLQRRWERWHFQHYGIQPRHERWSRAKGW